MGRRGKRTDSACFLNFSELQLRVDGVVAMPHRLDAVDVAVRESTRLVMCRASCITCRTRWTANWNCASWTTSWYPPRFLGYAQLEHKELLYKMPGQGWRNLDLVDDPAGAYLGVLRSFSEIVRHLHEVASIRRGARSEDTIQVWSGGRRRKTTKCSPRSICEAH